MGAVLVTPTTKPSCSCMDRAGEAPSPSTLNSVMATRVDITPPWAEGGGTEIGGRSGAMVGTGAVDGGEVTGLAGSVAAGGGGPLASGFDVAPSAAGFGCARADAPDASTAAQATVSRG